MKKQTKSIKKNSKSSSRFMRWASGGFANPQSRMIAVIVIIMFIGSSTVLFTRAASPSQTEPETWQRVAMAGSDGCVKSIDDLTASEGRAIEFACSTTTPGGSTGGNQDHDSHASDNCTPGIGRLGTMGPCINRSLIPAARPGVSTVAFDQTTPKRLSPPAVWGGGEGEPGAFRTRCDFSHMNNDDAVLYQNQPNKAHLHTYFGNTGTNASSTSASLKNSGNSTCSGGTLNRSAYWIPSMIDTATGRPLAPNDDRSQYNSDLEIYYKVGYQGIGYRDIKPFPNGLQMIAGNPANATTAPSPARNGSRPVVYYCEGAASNDRTRNREGTNIPVCNSGEVLVMDIDFPQCWDGVNLRATNGRSHVTYGKWHNLNSGETTPISEDAGCPPSHPVSLPHIEMFVRWRVPAGTNTSNWRLSSDNYTNGPGGYSGHADYIFAWEDYAFPTLVTRCYAAQQDCGYQLGDGREPRWIRFW